MSLDNGTMVEALKYLNYCQLSKNSLVSMKFCNVIQTHRHKLALLHVHYIGIYSIKNIPTVIKVFDKELSSQEYNEWVIRNQYSKEVTLVDEITCTESAQDIPNGCWLRAFAHYKDLNNREWDDRTNIYCACVELNHESWPLFQHFVRLATDPFIYVNSMELTYQNALLNSLSGAINPNRRLQCKKFSLDLRRNLQKSFTWIKNHVRCNQLWTYGEFGLSQDVALLDFFVTGGHCTTAIEVNSSISKVVVDFVQKFMDLKPSDDRQLVDAIDGYFDGQAVDLMKRNYDKLVVKEERHGRSTEQIFEYVNSDIGKKLQLTAKYEHRYSYCSIKIDNL